MSKKMYSAFISSVYEKLQDERNLVIDSLLDYRVFPVCMEHFTVSTNGKFSDIEALIDSSDFFILILGKNYGSCDENGVSWTEREYDYAVKNKKRILALVCDELAEMMRADESTLSESDLKQIEFCEKVEFARTISARLTIPKIIGQFFSQVDFSSHVGWVRDEQGVMKEEDLLAWQQSHKAFDVGGVWYHVHFSEGDEKYIRAGTIQIKQSFDPKNYQRLYLDAFNYSVRYDAQKKKLCENLLQRSHWTGEYTIDDTGAILGIYHSKREFKSTFNNFEVDRGIRRGIHDFVLDISKNERVELFHGEFHDEAPSPKTGVIYAFRTEQARLEFLEENFLHVLSCNG
jgi:hypothetical protein